MYRLKQQVEEYRKSMEQKRRSANIYAKEPPLKQDGVNGWKCEPPIALSFAPAREIVNDYAFKYAILASDCLTFEKGAVLKRSYAGGFVKHYAFAGAGASTGATGPGPFLYGGDFNAGDMPGSFAGFFGPLLVMSRPFKPVIVSPPGAEKILPGTQALVLQKGDYIAENLPVSSIILPKLEPVRIFLVPQENSANSSSSGPVFESTFAASINAVPECLPEPSKASLQIWYGGSREICLGDYTRFCGIIYAPNATVKIGKNCRFMGAMVAKNVIVGQDSEITYSPALAQWR